jgi:hypothetical protein
MKDKEKIMEDRIESLNKLLKETAGAVQRGSITTALELIAKTMLIVQEIDLDNILEKEN